VFALGKLAALLLSRIAQGGAGVGSAVVEVLLRGLAAGAMTATALGLLRGGGDPAARRAGAVFSLAAAAFALHSGGPETLALGLFSAPVWLLSAGGAGYFWLFAVILFGDRRPKPGLLAPAALLTLVAATATSLPRSTANGVWIAHNLIELALVVHILIVVGRSWASDLVDVRRSVRGPFMAAIGIYMSMLSGLEIAELLGVRPAWTATAESATLLMLALVGATLLLEAREPLFEAPTPSARPERVAPRDRPALDRLLHLMAESEIWRREGLTIAQLADAVGTPEHRLRQLINVGLGHRNFPEFLNARRVAAAQAILSNPAFARRPISSLAFDLGYASLSPFNRAFKEATGVTPSAWRDRALAASAIPNNAD
jgi:AraC-like DNA-binding protein